MFALCKHARMSNLSSYLETHGIKHSAFAARLGISRSYLSLILSGKRGVDLNLAFQIEAETDGQVTARSFSSTNGEAEAASQESTPNKLSAAGLSALDP